jgi:hypothetical protein
MIRKDLRLPTYEQYMKYHRPIRVKTLMNPEAFLFNRAANAYDHLVNHHWVKIPVIESTINALYRQRKTEHEVWMYLIYLDDFLKSEHRRPSIFYGGFEYKDALKLAKIQYQEEEFERSNIDRAFDERPGVAAHERESSRMYADPSGGNLGQGEKAGGLHPVRGLGENRRESQQLLQKRGTTWSARVIAQLLLGRGRTAEK